MSSSVPLSSSREPVRARSFRALVLTQFLGAFNDNAFKQTVALVAVNLRLAEKGGTDYQGLALGLFSLPFVLFSGIAGSLADRYSKTRVIFWAKVAEIVAMLLAAAGFWAGNIAMLLAVVFVMGTQSAFFGPAKYGILPEMLPARRLSRANGVILMTTFLSIILGTAAAGYLKDHLGDALYLAGTLYLVIACVGTVAARGIERLPAARPGFRVGWSPLGDLFPTLLRIWKDRDLCLVVVANSFFWFLGGVMHGTINLYGVGLMGLSDTATSNILVTLSAGIAAGSITGGLLSRRSVNFALVWWGLGGLVLSLAALLVAHELLWVTHATVFTMGMSGGLYCLPLQTFVQIRAPEGEKGRVVAATNFVNWVFIFLSSAAYALLSASVPIPWIPFVLAILSAAVGVPLVPRLRALSRLKD